MAQDLYRYFRIEARELVEALGQGLLALEKAPAPELVPQLLRLAHTLKGAARVVRQQAIAEHTHAIEEILGQLRDPRQRVAREQIDAVLKLLDQISALLLKLDAPGAPQPLKPAGAPVRPQLPAEASAPEEPLRMLRADIAEMDSLLDGLSEANVQLRAVRDASRGLEQVRRLADLLLDQLGPVALRSPLRPTEGTAKARSVAEELRRLTESLEQRLASGVDQTERELAQVRDAAERLRLLPASALLAPLERTLRDVAQALGKRATLVLKGGEVRLDAYVLGQVQGALVQAVRNAVAHGIEGEAERSKLHKPAVGRVELEVARRGKRVAFVCRDDGRGVDLDAVRHAAQKAGVPSAASATQEELLSLLMRGGLSTSRDITELSGRGIGLDLVRETAARLDGQVRVYTEPGRGTSIELVVPVSLASMDTLLVEASGIAAGIPLEAVRRTVRLLPGDVVRAPEGDSIVYEGRVIPFAPLARTLRGAGQLGTAAACSAVVVGGGANALAALSVDRLRGTANVVVRPLPPFAPADPVVAGTWLDAEGLPQLVLDPESLVEVVGRSKGRAAPAAEAAPATPILVIDDSLTTRMLEQSILESAGYQVELATSAEEALEKAAQRRYSLFLVDVEMPGMDGFAFVEKTRAHPVLRSVPAILVSSRNAPEDRQRGRDVGASAYIVKGEFDQVRLISTIRGLVTS